MVIYKATNKINDKVYVGQTVQSLRIRKSRHIYDANNGCDFNFHRAIRKYGINNFEWVIIRICNNINELNAFEQYYILYYDSMDNGYNLKSGGRNGFLSEETKAKISKNNTRPMLGKHLSTETKEKLRQARLGSKHSDVTKELMSKNSTKYWLGKKLSKEHCENLRIAHINKKASVEAREKMSIAKLNMSDKTRKKMSKAKSGKNHPMYNKHHTKGSREKMRLGHLGTKASAEAKIKMSIARTGEKNPNYGKPLSKEHRLKISNSLKKYYKINKETK